MAWSRRGGWACWPPPADATDSDRGAGALAGAAIATLDLGLVAPRRAPAIAELPQLPQWADHLAFGALVGLHL